MKGASAYQEPVTYWNFIRSEATLIDTDGCSRVSGFQVDCCFEHDLGYYYAADPRDAYRLYRLGDHDYWQHASPITREDVDSRFRKCHQTRSKFGQWSPMAFWRWLGVRRFGQSRWDAHRERERGQLFI